MVRFDIKGHCPLCDHPVVRTRISFTEEDFPEFVTPPIEGDDNFVLRKVLYTPDFPNVILKRICALCGCTWLEFTLQTTEEQIATFEKLAGAELIVTKKNNLLAQKTWRE